MKQLIFSAALLCASVDAMKTNALLQQNFDAIFGDAKVADQEDVQLENVDGASNAYVVDSLGNLYVTEDHFDQFPADDINLKYAAPRQTDSFQ